MTKSYNLLLTALQNQKNAFKRGDFKSLTRISTEIEKTLTKLDPENLSALDKDMLKKISRENATLLEASLRGLRRTKKIIENYSKNCENFSTYTNPKKHYFK